MKKNPKLDFSSLAKATKSLAEAVTESYKQPNNTYIRDAMIQRFEYTYELSHKMLKRYLELTEPTPGEVDQMPFANLIRTGSEKGLLLNGWDIWIQYRHARNMTSHTYNEIKAKEVCAIIPDFLKETEFLLAKLHERLELND